MDWFSWLSESNLHPSLVRDYSLCLTTNELDEDDLAFFDDAFLRSMGISVAKHRAEILSLAKKTTRGRRRRRRLPRSSSSRRPPPAPLPAVAVAKLAATIKRSRNCFTRYVGALGCSTTTGCARLVEPATWVLSPTRSARWSSGGAVLGRRKTKVGLLEKGMRPTVDDRRRRRESGGDGHGHWCSAGGGRVTRWDAMFQNLKPT